MVGTYAYAREGASAQVNSDNSNLTNLFGGNPLFTIENYDDLQIDLQEISGGGGRTTFVILVSGASKT